MEDNLQRALKTAEDFAFQLLDTGVLCVMLTGNLVHNRCAQGSDIDLKAITTGDFVGKKVTDDFKGYMVDCEHYPLHYLRSALPEGDMNLVAKMKNSRFFMGDADVDAEIRGIIGGLPFDKMAFRLFQIGGGNLNEAQNEFDLKDYDASIVLAREGVTYLAQALLLRYRDVQVRTKYIIKGLRTVCSEHKDFVEKYFVIHGLRKSEKVKSRRDHAEYVINETVFSYGYVQHLFKFWLWDDADVESSSSQGHPL